MKRVFLFLATNIAILIILSIVLSLIGVESILDEQGVDLDLTGLLIFSSVFGMGGSFLSLAISQWTAKPFTGALFGPLISLILANGYLLTRDRYTVRVLFPSRLVLPRCSTKNGFIGQVILEWCPVACSP